MSAPRLSACLQGTFGAVVELRNKRAGGSVFAAKLYKEERLSLDKLAFAGVLSELRALLRVNASWQASDALDDRWCPLVHLHGLFLTPQVGLLMEKVRRPRSLLCCSCAPALDAAAPRMVSCAVRHERV